MKKNPQIVGKRVNSRANDYCARSSLIILFFAFSTSIKLFQKSGLEIFNALSLCSFLFFCLLPRRIIRVLNLWKPERARGLSTLSLRGGLNQVSARDSFSSFTRADSSISPNVCLFVCLLNTPLSRQVERGWMFVLLSSTLADDYSSSRFYSAPFFPSLYTPDENNDGGYPIDYSPRPCPLFGPRRRINCEKDSVFLSHAKRVPLCSRIQPECTRLFFVRCASCSSSLLRPTILVRPLLFPLNGEYSRDTVEPRSDVNNDKSTGIVREKKKLYMLPRCSFFTQEFQRRFFASFENADLKGTGETRYFIFAAQHA